MTTLSREQFHRSATEGVLVPVYRELPADLETPVSVYLKLRRTEDGRQPAPSFLLESVERAEQIGRYSFLGFSPHRQIIARGQEITVVTSGQTETRKLTEGEDPLDVVRAEIATYQPVAPVHHLTKGLPRFFGGAVGYLGYDMVRYFERLPDKATGPDGAPYSEDQDLGMPDMHLMITDTLVVFDHVQHRLLLFANANVPSGTDLDGAYDDAIARLDVLEARLQAPLTNLPAAPGPADVALTSSLPQIAYEDAVRTAKDYIKAGDIFQVVLSQRLARPTEADPFSIYRTLRRVNPSPYMFFLDLGGDPATALVGSSPEVLVRLQDRTAAVRPIAGTRRRGQTPAEDKALAADLLADPKERAEHVMLVDLGRNDLGRVCEFNTIHVPELLTTEFYSHVIHLVSHVEGRLRGGLDAIDLLRATFPAGTVSGAPKVRAMEIIDELEGLQRGPYAGAVGYFGFNGNMDTCITIRTIYMVGQTAYLQAGAGIVADSDPTREYHETLHKAKALSVAIAMAERGE